MYRLLVIPFLLWTLNMSATNDKYYEVNEGIKSSYQDIMALNISDARSSLSELKASQPNNYSTLHLANYVDFLELIISENEGLYNKRLIERSQRIEEILVNKNGDASPYHKYVLGEIYLHWAIVKFKFQDYYSGFRDASKAYRYFRQNRDLHPDFLLNSKGLGTIETLVGVIPENLRWGVKLLGGLQGDITSGLEKLNYAYNNLEDGDIFKKETGIIYAYLLLHYGNKKEDSWKVIESLNLNTSNPTDLFIKSSLAHYVGKNDLTIEMLSTYRQEPGAMQFDYLSYMLGIAKLNRLDADADDYLLNYIQNFKGQYYIKDAYLRLAWHALVQGDLIGYDRYLALVKTKGSSDINYDKTALRYAKEKQVPNVPLLKARLLYDGGYYQQADDLLSVLRKYSLKSAKDQLEYTYRLGRIRQQLNLNKEAIKLFKETIASGRHDKSHYACNSALQMGLIHESTGHHKHAIESYKICLSINPSDYKQSLHHRAKAGLQRLK